MLPLSSVRDPLATSNVCKSQVIPMHLLNDPHQQESTNIHLLPIQYLIFILLITLH